MNFTCWCCFSVECDSKSCMENLLVWALHVLLWPFYGLHNLRENLAVLQLTVIDILHILLRHKKTWLKKLAIHRVLHPNVLTEGWVLENMFGTTRYTSSSDNQSLQRIVNQSLILHFQGFEGDAQGGGLQLESALLQPLWTGMARRWSTKMEQYKNGRKCSRSKRYLGVLWWRKGKAQPTNGGLDPSQVWVSVRWPLPHVFPLSHYLLSSNEDC